MYITICKTDIQRKFAVWCRELSLVLGNNLEEWDEVGSGREGQEGGDTCTPVADSHCDTAETNAKLKAIIL